MKTLPEDVTENFRAGFITLFAADAQHPIDDEVGPGHQFAVEVVARGPRPSTSSSECMHAALVHRLAQQQRIDARTPARQSRACIQSVAAVVATAYQQHHT